eukprot:761391-Hanusia_phi.AAC.1
MIAFVRALVRSPGTVRRRRARTELLSGCSVCSPVLKFFYSPPGHRVLQAALRPWQATCAVTSGVKGEDP